MSKLTYWLLPTLSIAAGSAAHATAPAPDETTIVVDVTIDAEDTAPSKDGTARTAVMLSLRPRGCAESRIEHGAANDHVKVCHVGGDPAAPTLEFEFRRSRGAGISHVLRVDAQLATGQPRLLGKLDDLGVKLQMTASARSK